MAHHSVGVGLIGRVCCKNSMFVFVVCIFIDKIASRRGSLAEMVYIIM